MVRCFVSVDIEDGNLLDALESVQNRLRDTGADLKFVKKENIHLTIKFLGEVRESLVYGLKDIVSSMKFDHFWAELKGVGTFPNLRRPRVVWTKVESGAVGFVDLFNRIEKDIVKMGFNPERRGFSPHVTLARVRSGRNRAMLVDEIMRLSDEPLGKFLVKHVRLKKSSLTPKGPIYSTLAESGA